MPPSFPVNVDNIDNAWRIVDTFESQMSTNIHTALMVALQIVDLEGIRNRVSSIQPIIMFLTDGEPTEGITDTSTIIKDVNNFLLTFVRI